MIGEKNVTGSVSLPPSIKSPAVSLATSPPTGKNATDKEGIGTKAAAADTLPRIGSSSVVTEATAVTRAIDDSVLLDQQRLSEEQLHSKILAAGLKYEDCSQRDTLLQRAMQAQLRITAREQYRRGDGNAEALAVGTQIYESRGSSRSAFLDEKFLRQMGGKEALLSLFDAFYANLFADPRMNVLFGWRDQELSTAEHGRRIALLLLEFNGLDSTNEYTRVYSPDHNVIGHIHEAHGRAQTCPMRPAVHRDEGVFTVQQRNAWLGNLSLACDARGVKDECKKTLLSWLVIRMNFYGPFIQE